MTVAVPCADGGDIALYLPLAAVACSLIRVLLLVPVPPPLPSFPFMSCHVISLVPSPAVVSPFGT